MGRACESPLSDPLLPAQGLILYYPQAIYTSCVTSPTILPDLTDIYDFDMMYIHKKDGIYGRGSHIDQA